MQFLTLMLIFAGIVLQGCGSSGVESQRARVGPISPWDNSGNPYQDPFANSPTIGTSPDEPTITIPDMGYRNGTGTIGNVGNTTCYKANAETCAIERLIFAKTNAYRASSGLKPLTFGYRLGYAARDWSTQQSNRGGISHSGFPSARRSFLAAEFGANAPADISGENVAWTGYSSGSVEAVASDFAEMWWGSSGHRRNMLGNYKSLGVGVYRGGRGWYATQIFGAE